MSRRALVLAAVWATVTGAILVVPGCYGRSCESSVGRYGTEVGQGRMIDEDTWESSPQDGAWLPFPGAQLYFFEIPALGDRRPQVILPYISPIEDPNVFVAGRPASNFTLAGGNSAELSGVGPNRFSIRNGTCADYFLRVVVSLEPRPPRPEPDAIADASAEMIDAGDASADAAIDAASNAETDAEAGP
jgi:hypothetical protein